MSNRRQGGFLMSEKDTYTREGDKRFTLRIENELFKKIELVARKDKRAIGREIEFILEDWLKNNHEE